MYFWDQFVTMSWRLSHVILAFGKYPSLLPEVLQLLFNIRSALILFKHLFAHKTYKKIPKLIHHALYTFNYLCDLLTSMTVSRFSECTRVSTMICFKLTKKQDSLHKFISKCLKIDRKSLKNYIIELE